MAIRNAIKNFKARNWKNATLLVELMVDAYCKEFIAIPERLLKILKSGLKGYVK